MYYCCENIASLSDEEVDVMKRSISAHFDEKVNLKRKESVAVKFLLCRILEDKFSLTDYIISADENGKPFLKNGNLFFSLSHSDDYVFCVVSKECVGCDVQKKAEYKQKISKRFFTDDEDAALLNSCNADEAFTRLWTLKESALKFTGEGISGGLSRYDFSDCINCDSFEKFGFKFTTIVKDEYVFSVCSKGTESCLYEFKMGGD